MAYKYISSSQPKAVHPRVNYWESIYTSSTGLEVDVQQERVGFGLGTPRLVVIFSCGQSGTVCIEEFDWEFELDEWLVEHNGRGSPESEKIRFSLWLHRALQPAVRKYSDGYFSRALLDVAKGDFAENAEVMDITQDIHRVGTVSQSDVAECTAMIESALSDVGIALRNLYGDTDSAFEILGNALAQYLDDRFSVSNRRLLGF